jgi:outer membrane protein
MTVLPTIPRRTIAGLALAALALAAPRMPAQDTVRTRPPSATITLADAIRIALDRNGTVRFARNATVLDSLSVRQARNASRPTLGASSSASQDVLNGSQAGANGRSVTAGLSSGITLYNGGQNRNILRQAELSQRAGVAELGRTQQTVVFVVASGFLALITQQEQLRVQRENLVAQEQELAQLERFLRAGLRPIGDIYQQQAAVASTRLAVVNARRAAERAKVDLIEELVLDPRLDYDFVPPAAGRAGTAPAFDLDSLITIALARRADVRSQQLRVQAAEQEIAIAEGGRRPTVTASGGYNVGYASTGDGGFVSQLDRRRGGSVGVGVSLPLLDRGAVSIARQRARVSLENELLVLRDQEQGVALEVRRAFLDYTAAQEQLVASLAQQRAAALSLEAAQARYRVGLATLVEVTLARASLVEAQSAVVSARSSLVFQQALMSYYTGVLDPDNVRLEPGAEGR